MFSEFVIGTSMSKENREPSFIEEIKQRQRNVLPPDIIAHDRDMNDVLWNGSSSNSKIQRAGAFVIGLAISLCALAVISMAVKRRAWLGLVIVTCIAGSGLRVMYKNLKKRR